MTVQITSYKKVIWEKTIWNKTMYDLLQNFVITFLLQNIKWGCRYVNKHFLYEKVNQIYTLTHPIL